MLSGRFGASLCLRRTARRWVIGVSVAATLVTGGDRAALAQTPPGVGQDVCNRTYQVSDAIVTASGAPNCGYVTLRHLREITALDLSYQGISDLSVGDFDGLVRLDALDLSSNYLTALPQGVFDELLLLRTLRLDNNALESVPPGLFDQLLLLEDVTLQGNPLLSLSHGMFGGWSRFAALQDNVDLPSWAVDAGSLDDFLDGVYTVEQFIAALPPLYKERFAMVYASESPAADHVSGDFPRVVSWGGDGRFTFAWNTDPGAPSEFRDVVEFLRRGDTAWSAGIVDFSAATPTVTEPASCQTCHGSLNKPLWGAWNTWEGTEFAAPDSREFQTARAAMERAIESTDPRIEPLDFDASSFIGDAQRYVYTPDYELSVAMVQEAGGVWSWRHAEVLHASLKASESDYWTFAETVMCEAKGTEGVRGARYKVTVDKFPVGDHNPAVLANTGEVIQGGDLGSGWVANPDYAYEAGGEIGSAVIFLMVVDLYQEEPIVRWLYRDVSNADTLLPERQRGASWLLYYPSGSATAEDELIQKLRLHFGEGTRSALRDRARQNGRYPYGGNQSAYFSDGHLDVMAPAVCDVLRNTQPTNLSVELVDDDAVLSWDAPEDTDSLNGYRILRGVDGEAPTTYVENTASTDTTWTDNGLTPGNYVWIVQALYDDYPSRESNAVRETVSGNGLQVSGPTSFTIVEGDTEVWTLSATGTDAPASDLAWSISGGPDSGHFTLTAGGALAFAAAKDYEGPDDAGGDGTYDVTVQVSDGTDDATADISVLLANRNEAPTANAGADQSDVEEGATVTLSGSGEDPDADDTVQYAWTQTGGDTVTLSAPSEAVTTFAAPTGLTENAVLTFTLEVSDAGGLAGEDAVTVTVVPGEQPSGPAVTGATSFTVVEGETAVGTLTATDEDTPAADLAWSISGGPDSGRFTLTAGGVLAFSAAKDYEAPDDAGGDGTYNLTVRVSDGTDDATADVSVSLSNRNEAPTADAGADQPGVDEGAAVTLSGSGQDPDAGDALEYAWTQTGGDAVTLSAPSAAVTTFAAPTGLTEDAVLTFTLRVSDAGGLTAEDTVTVTVVAAEEPEGPPLTASFHGVPASHDGRAFTFELRFSEEVSISFRTLRDSSFTVTNGQVRRARRVNAGSNLRWEIRVRPAAAGDVTIVLPGGRACNAVGAVCTEGGKPLSNSPSATVQ